jgi:hypothetical protein
MHCHPFHVLGEKGLISTGDIEKCTLDEGHSGRRYAVRMWT